MFLKYSEMWFSTFCSTVANNPGVYIPKELKSESIGVFQSVEFCGNPAQCAIMCNHLFDSKQAYVYLESSKTFYLPFHNGSTI